MLFRGGLPRRSRLTVDQRFQYLLAGADQAGAAAPGFLRMVLVPSDPVDVRDLVPGMRFTGSIDTRTGPPNPKFAA